MGIKLSLTSHIPEVVREMEQAADRKMHEVVNEVRNITLDTLSGSRSGEMYKVPDTRKDYQASAEGEAPASATGGLRQSVKTEVESKGKKVTGSVGTELEYGKHLEIGTSRMKPRPWLRRSFEKASPKAKDILGGKWF